MTISAEAEKVRAALIEKGIETPMKALSMAKDERRTEIQQKMREVMELIGLDLTDDSLEETPTRLAKMYIDEIFSGLDYANFPKITNIENRMKVSEMVLVNDVTLTSTCEHHFVTIDGLVSVAYYPKKWVIGLSKINRVVQ
ncbi:MAG: GTP cyclohydrolase I FolE, partial [Actinobacillus porcinus]